MRKRNNKTAAIFWVAAVSVFFVGTASADEAAWARGKYIFDAAGCVGCHTDKQKDGKSGPLAAGGRALKTDFGTFYSPNITPDAKTGIGGWSDADFIRALRHGISPGGDPYYPSFPYPSYTLMSDADLGDLKAYLFSLPPVQRQNRDHDLKVPFGWRVLLYGWRALYFTEGPAAAPAPTLTRGAYLTNALGHCGECHTPRDWLGGPDRRQYLAGTRDGPSGGVIPNLTPDRETGLGKWSAGDLETFFRIGMLPDGDFAGAKMGEVITNTTAKLTPDDRAALIDHLSGLPPIKNPVKPKKAKQTGGDDW